MEEYSCFWRLHVNLNEIPPQGGNNITNDQKPTSLQKLSPVAGAILTAVCVLLAILYGGMASQALPAGTFGALLILLLLPALFAYLCLAGYFFQPMAVAAASLITPVICAVSLPSDAVSPAASVGMVLESLVPAACGLALFVSYKKRMRRTGGIVLAAVFAGILFAGSLAVGIYNTYGSLGGDTVMTMLDELRTAMTDAVSELVAEMKDSLSSLGGVYESAAMAELDPEFLVNGIFNVLPAIVIVTLSVLAYLMQRFFFTCFRVFRAGDDLFTPEMKTFEVSAPTAAIFALGFIISIFLTSSSGAAKAVLDNLTMILEPGLALTGLSSILPKREGNMVRVGCFPIVAVVILLFVSLNIAVVVLAVIGTVSVLKKAFGELKKS